MPAVKDKEARGGARLCFRDGLPRLWTLASAFSVYLRALKCLWLAGCHQHEKCWRVLSVSGLDLIWGKRVGCGKARYSYLAAMMAEEAAGDVLRGSSRHFPFL